MGMLGGKGVGEGPEHQPLPSGSGHHWRLQTLPAHPEQGRLAAAGMAWATAPPRPRRSRGQQEPAANRGTSQILAVASAAWGGTSWRRKLVSAGWR